MKRFLEYNPNQVQKITLNPAEKFPPGTFLFWLVCIIEKIDYSPLYEYKDEEDRFDKGGPPGYAPQGILAIIIWGIIDGHNSMRAIAIECRHDDRYRYISGGITPSHSTLSRFIQFNGYFLYNLFDQVLKIADTLAFIDYSIVVSDGTKQRADAAKALSATREQFMKKVANYDIKLAMMASKKVELPVDDLKQVKLSEHQHYLLRQKKKIIKLLDTHPDQKDEEGYKKRLNLTDPDCLYAKFYQSAYFPGYNCQITSSRNWFIIGTYICDEVNEIHQLKPQLEEMLMHVPINKIHTVMKTLKLFDAGYFLFAEVMTLSEKNNIYCPSGIPRRELLLAKLESGENCKINIHFCELLVKDGIPILFCPGGRNFTKYRTGVKKKKEYCIFEVDENEQCKKCKYHDNCKEHLKNPARKRFELNKEWVDYYTEYKKYQEKINSEYGKEIYSQRMGIIERVFAHIKSRFRFVRFPVRGNEKVQVYWNLVCTTFNMYTLIHLCQRKKIQAL